MLIYDYEFISFKRIKFKILELPHLYSYSSNVR